MDEQYLQCIICIEDYTKEKLPRLLPCGHTVCTSCLKQILSEGHKCPECRSLLLQRKLTKYPVNFAIWGLSQHYNACYGKGGIKALKALYATNIQRDINEVQSFQNKWESEINAINRLVKDFENPLKTCEKNKIIFSTSKARKEMLLARIPTVFPLKTALAQSLELIHQAVTISDMENAINNASKCRSDFDKVKLYWEVSSECQEYDGYKKRVLWNALESKQNVFVTSTIDNKQKWAKVTHTNNKILLYSLQDGFPPHGGCNIPFEALRKLVPKDSPTVFLEVERRRKVQGHVFLRMFGSTPRSIQTTLLCSGEMGPSYRKTVFYDVAHWPDKTAKLIRGGDYENNNGTGGQAIVEGITSGGVYTREVKAGLLVSWPYEELWHLGSFDIYLSDQPFLVDHSSYGIVTEGIDILLSAAKKQPVSKTRVLDCGLVIHS